MAVCATRRWKKRKRESVGVSALGCDHFATDRLCGQDFSSFKSAQRFERRLKTLRPFSSLWNIQNMYILSAG
jgi:hypothetical protein